MSEEDSSERSIVTDQQSLSENDIPKDELLLSIYRESLEYISKVLGAEKPPREILTAFPDIKTETERNAVENDSIYKEFSNFRQKIGSSWLKYEKLFKRAEQMKEYKLLANLLKDIKERNKDKIDTSEITITDEMKQTRLTENFKCLLAIEKLLEEKERKVTHENELGLTSHRDETQTRTEIDTKKEMQTNQEAMKEIVEEKVDDSSSESKDAQTIEKLNEKIDKLNSKLEKKDEEKRKLHKRLDKKIQEIAEMQAQMEGLQQAHEKGNTAITAKEEGTGVVEELKKTTNELKEKLESKEVELQTSHHNCDVILKETDALREHRCKIEDDIEVLHNENQRLVNLLKKPGNEIKQKLRQYVAENKKLKTDKDELQKRCEEYESGFKQVMSKRQRVERPQTAPASSERYLKELQHTIETLKGEKESLMQRLSMVAGRKMKDNNPAIADLSDPNRPEKLTEQFREIYDNAWTDVLDCLTENEKVKDEVAVKQIVDVLQAIYEQCKCQIEKRKQTIIELIGYPEDTLEKQYTGGKDGHDPTVKIIKDLVQGSAARIWEDVIQKIKKTPVVTKILETGEEKSDIFVTKCSHLCLYMAVQDPPVVLDFSCKPGDPFNKDLFTPFTSSGDIVDYLVWPVTYLSQSGAIMSKGIAQGKKTIAKKQNEDN